MFSEEICCPICKKDDQIQKVTTVVRSGSASSTFGMGSATGSASGSSYSQTDLSEMLDFPYRRFSQIHNLTTAGIVIVVVSFLPVLCPLVYIVGSTIQGSFPSFSSPGWLFLEYFSPVMLLGILLIVVPRLRRRIILNREKPQRERAEKIWEQLYYCYRNDVVFVPGDQQMCVPATKMRTLIGF